MPYIEVSQTKPTSPFKVTDERISSSADSKLISQFTIAFKSPVFYQSVARVFRYVGIYNRENIESLLPTIAQLDSDREFGLIDEIYFDLRSTLAADTSFHDLKRMTKFAKKMRVPIGQYVFFLKTWELARSYGRSTVERVIGEVLKSPSPDVVEGIVTQARSMKGLWARLTSNSYWSHGEILKLAKGITADDLIEKKEIIPTDEVEALLTDSKMNLDFFVEVYVPRLTKSQLEEVLSYYRRDLNSEIKKQLQSRLDLLGSYIEALQNSSKYEVLAQKVIDRLSDSRENGREVRSPHYYLYEGDIHRLRSNIAEIKNYGSIRERVEAFRTVAKRLVDTDGSSTQYVDVFTKMIEVMPEVFSAFSDAVKILGVIIHYADELPINDQDIVYLQNRMEQLLGNYGHGERIVIAFNKMMEDWDPFGKPSVRNFLVGSMASQSSKKEIVERVLRARSEARTRLAELRDQIMSDSQGRFPDVGELKNSTLLMQTHAAIMDARHGKANQILIGSTSLPYSAVENISKELIDQVVGLSVRSGKAFHHLESAIKGKFDANELISVRLTSATEMMKQNLMVLMERIAAQMKAIHEIELNQTRNSAELKIDHLVVIQETIGCIEDALNSVASTYSMVVKLDISKPEFAMQKLSEQLDQLNEVLIEIGK